MRSQVLHQSLKSCRPIHVRLLNYRANGQPFVNDLTIMPIIDRATNTTSHFLGVLRERPLPEPRASLAHQPVSEPVSEATPAPTGSEAASTADAAAAASQPPPVLGPMKIPTQLQEALQVRMRAQGRRISNQHRRAPVALYPLSPLPSRACTLPLALLSA